MFASQFRQPSPQASISAIEAALEAVRHKTKLVEGQTEITRQVLSAHHMLFTKETKKQLPLPVTDFF